MPKLIVLVAPLAYKQVATCSSVQHAYPVHITINMVNRERQTKREMGEGKRMKRRAEKRKSRRRKKGKKYKNKIPE